MVAALGYEAYRRSFGSTSRDQKGELQLMVQVGHAHALFAAKAGSAEQADYSLTGIAEQHAKQGKELSVHPCRHCGWQGGEVCPRAVILHRTSTQHM